MENFLKIYLFNNYDFCNTLFEEEVEKIFNSKIYFLKHTKEIKKNYSLDDFLQIREEKKERLIEEIIEEQKEYNDSVELYPEVLTKKYWEENETILFNKAREMSEYEYDISYIGNLLQEKFEYIELKEGFVLYNTKGYCQEDSEYIIYFSETGRDKKIEKNIDNIFWGSKLNGVFSITEENKEDILYLEDFYEGDIYDADLEEIKDSFLKYMKENYKEKTFKYCEKYIKEFSPFEYENIKY